MLATRGGVLLGAPGLCSLVATRITPLSTDRRWKAGAGLFEYSHSGGTVKSYRLEARATSADVFKLPSSLSPHNAARS
jgi:hypothetical protein